jgi:hydrogenase maturation protein HypF
VEELRRRKLRVDKPFALMMPDMTTIERYCMANFAERDLLESYQRPIVLLNRKPGSIISSDVAPNQDTLGVMLPYTPLHYLIFNSCPQELTALVMTSGNLSEEPIATGNDEARRRLALLADGFLMNNRDIQTRCDDSVTRIFENKPIFIRRSRGYAPDSVQLPIEIPNILATGPELKNTFCLTREKYAFLSHHIGDMENYETLHSFEESIGHFERMFRIRPEAIAYDIHPNYLSSRYAIKRAELDNLPAFGVQHHHAHIAACLADNGRNGKRPVIGLAFDGTGYGDDGAIWGGEFLVADYSGYERKYHLAYFPLPGGDAAIRHPARTALALLWALGIDWDEDLRACREMSHDERDTLRTQLERNLNTVQTSSLGRLFDAVAALVGIRQSVNYEAQAAIEFESAVDKFETSSYRFDVQNGIVDVRPVIIAILADIHNGIAIPTMAARFHNCIIDMVRSVCDQIRNQTGINEIALSGGVWQNVRLLELAVPGLIADDFQVNIHRQVPTSDGGLSLGQVMVGGTRFLQD